MGSSNLTLIFATLFLYLLLHFPSQAEARALKSPAKCPKLLHQGIVVNALDMVRKESMKTSRFFDGLANGKGTVPAFKPALRECASDFKAASGLMNLKVLEGEFATMDVNYALDDARSCETKLAMDKFHSILKRRTMVSRHSLSRISQKDAAAPNYYYPGGNENLPEKLAEALEPLRASHFPIARWTQAALMDEFLTVKLFIRSVKIVTSIGDAAARDELCTLGIQGNFWDQNHLCTPLQFHRFCAWLRTPEGAQDGTDADFPAQEGQARAGCSHTCAELDRLDAEDRPASDYKALGEQAMTRLCVERYEEECQDAGKDIYGSPH
ncbi:hypothetical protein OIU79_017477 [Salix purpurea]|uniref:Pectinesterase inhibitor domain-containing protein n=1 Tax=Salix purpurea TaxID=77065 RepID=A0A9Q0WVN3_SALPP|nr:hypothetical protein OIU79_017477 [Salix purpurea]